MLEITRVTISPNLPLIGKDLDVGATLNADVAAAQTDLPAGTIMVLTEGVLREMVKLPALPVPFPAVPGVFPLGTIIGILAADSYATVPAANRPAMIYRRGTFIRSTVNEVNAMVTGAGAGAALGPINYQDASDNALNDRGIFLEESWDEGALGVPPI